MLLFESGRGSLFARSFLNLAKKLFSPASLIAGVASSIVQIKNGKIYLPIDGLSFGSDCAVIFMDSEVSCEFQLAEFLF